MYPDPANKCRVYQSGTIPDWFAAYVVVPDGCSRSNYVDQLITLGADFIFLNGKGNEEDFVLSSNGLNVPVFTLNNTLSDFAMKVETMLALDPKASPYDYYKDSMQIHVTMPNVIYFIN